MYKVYTKLYNWETGFPYLHMKEEKDTLKKAITACDKWDRIYTSIYYLGAYVKEINLKSSEEVIVYKSQRFQEVEQEEIIKQQKRTKLLNSWGITEKEVKARDLAIDVETHIFGETFQKKEKEVILAKKSLADLLINYDKVIEEAKEEVTKKTEALNDYISKHQTYQRNEYDKDLETWETTTYSISDIQELWAKAGGKEKWKNIDLRKKGPVAT